MDVREIVDLVNLVAAKDIAELEVERDGVKVRIVKAPPAAPGAARSYEAPTASRPHLVAVEHLVPALSAAPAVTPVGASAPGEAVEEGMYLMRSPIVGTFYRSPSPSAEPYVKPEDRVKKGQVLCIVEAMKLMNEIESEVSGAIVDVLVEDGQPVEYGEPLYKIRLDR